MGLRIATNIASQEVQKNLSQVTGRSEQSLAKLSSGMRINKAVDDAAGLAISQRLRATSSGLAQATRNANNGISYVQTAEGALNESSNIVVRLRELSVQAASDTVGDNERELLNFEYQQLVEEVDRIADSAEFNGLKLINGQGNGVLSFHVGAAAGEENKIEYDSDETDATPAALGIEGLNVLEKGARRMAWANWMRPLIKFLVFEQGLVPFSLVCARPSIACKCKRSIKMMQNL